MMLNNFFIKGASPSSFFLTKISSGEKSPPDSHYLAQDELRNTLGIKIAWKLGKRKAFENSYFAL